MQMASPDQSTIVTGRALPRRAVHLTAERRGPQIVNGGGSVEIAGSCVSTLIEPNLLVQSCVKNVRDLFQALSRCGFTSVNPFPHRSPAVRLPHVMAGAELGAAALAPRFGEWGDTPDVTLRIPTDSLSKCLPVYCCPLAPH